MNALTKLPLLAMMMIAVSGCSMQQGGSAVDRLRPMAAEHAASLAGDDMAAARKTGVILIESLEAYAGW